MENNKIHILVVDDDNRIRDLLKEYLTDKNYIVSTSDNAENAKIKITQFKFDLIVLDVMMPGQNGYELTKEIKKTMKVPIILLTAKGEVENRIKGLELGADDYIGKPFEPKELLLRIKNLTNKNKKIDLNIKHFVGNAQIDLNKMNIILEEKNKKINLSEKKVLVEMLSNPGKTYSREEIGKISGINQERSIDVMITRLRQKIEINPKNPKPTMEQAIRQIKSELAETLKKHRANNKLLEEQRLRERTKFDLEMIEATGTCAENTFGDILTDEAAILTASMGLLPSASLSGVPQLGSLSSPVLSSLALGPLRLLLLDLNLSLMESLGVLSSTTISSSSYSSPTLNRVFQNSLSSSYPTTNVAGFSRYLFIAFLPINSLPVRASLIGHGVLANIILLNTVGSWHITDMADTCNPSPPTC